MFRRLMTYGSAALLAIGAACLTEGDPVLYIVVSSTVPDTTSETQLGISGEVRRTPQQRGAVMAVTVTGGAFPAVDTASMHGLFTVTVPLLANSDNDLSLTAADNTGATTTSAWRRTVVHVDPPLTHH